MSRMPAVRMREQPIEPSLWRGRLPDLTIVELGNLDIHVEVLFQLLLVIHRSSTNVVATQ